MGVAAPQVGIPRAAAIVIPPDPGAEPVVMLNPQVIRESAESDEQYVLSLDNAMARLAAHEIDHLNGRLYTSRMREGTRPIPVAEYRGTGGPAMRFVMAGQGGMSPGPVMPGTGGSAGARAG
jgi:peptide deformylase